MPMEELTIQRREATGKQVAKQLRRGGRVPAILYGGARPEPITVEPKTVLRMLQGREGSTQLLTLRFDGEAGSRLAIIRDLQFDPVTDRLLHLDLQEVSADRPITVSVAIHTVGEPVGVKEQKGILNLVLHEMEISCLPGALPERIDADVTPLRIGDVLTLAALRLPEGVRALGDPEQAVAIVAPPRTEEEGAPGAAAVAEPEVLTERKAKVEEGGEEAKKGKK